MPMFFKIFLLAFMLSSPLWSAASWTKRKVISKNQPVLLKADTLTHDHMMGTVQAKGNVLFFSGDEILEADIVTFNQETNTVVATGHVRLTHASPKNKKGKKDKETILFANYMELTSDLRDGFIQEIQALLHDDSKFVAVSGQKKGLKTRFYRARYSPCKVCRKSTTPALWQLNAKSVTWHQDTHDISYRDAVMEFWGIPVFYTPYLHHPDPSVKRRSGVLVPSLGQSGSLGMFGQVPYFFALDSDKDLILTPLFTSKAGQFLGTKYRHVFRRGRITLNGSGGSGPRVKKTAFKRTDKNNFRGHVDAHMLYNLTHNWRISSNVLRVTDKTYLAKYPFYGHTAPGFLNSKAMLEGFYPRTYMRVQAQHTQSTKEEDRQRHIPFVAPAVDINYESRPGRWGSWWNLDGNILSVQRHVGQTTHRGVGSIGWSIPWKSPIGDRYVLSLVTRGDLYATKDSSEGLTQKQREEPDRTLSRLYPQARLLYELPFYKNMKNYTMIIGPEVSLVTSKVITNHKNFPNEDNYLKEPTDTSLFSLNRMQGYDRLDEGTRLTYGIKSLLYRSQAFQIEAFLGQTHQFSQNKNTLYGTGFEHKNSDLVGRLNANLLNFVDLRYRFRLDKKTLNPHRQELGFSLGKHVFKIHIDYLNLPSMLVDERVMNNKHNQYSKAADIASQQLQVGFTVNPHRNWTIRAATLEALGNEEHRSLAHKGSIEYHNECLIVELNASKNYYRNQELKPDTIYFMRLTFKNLGSVNTPHFGRSSTRDDKMVNPNESIPISF